HCLVSAEPRRKLLGHPRERERPTLATQVSHDLQDLALERQTSVSGQGLVELRGHGNEMRPRPSILDGREEWREDLPDARLETGAQAGIHIPCPTPRVEPELQELVAERRRLDSERGWKVQGDLGPNPPGAEILREAAAL